MKTKRILTLFIALLIGVMVNAQNFAADSKAYEDQMSYLEYLKVMWVIEFGNNNPDYLINLIFMKDEPQATPTLPEKVQQYRVVGNADTSPYVSHSRVNSRVPHFKDEIAVKNLGSGRNSNRY